MADLQGVSAVFRSMDAAVMANQAVQAADMAARQGLASVQRDARRQEDRVTETLDLADSAQISGDSQGGAQAGPGTSRRRRTETTNDAGPASGGGHHIDLIA